ncbi:hypothetical protein CPB86DRAFT_799479 [Serendipita vermifera]|nr:hypothetical protein CPB86DRAFT_799479 [Serendipita vermifera]
MDRRLVSDSKLKSIRGLVSEREVEISLLEAKILEMDHEADQDIPQRWYCTGRPLRLTQKRKEHWMDETTDHVAIRTAKLLEEQEPVYQKLRSLKRANQLSRASIASVRKIPNEVLSLIFQEYVDMGHSVWALGTTAESLKGDIMVEEAIYAANQPIRLDFIGCRHHVSVNTGQP